MMDENIGVHAGMKSEPDTRTYTVRELLKALADCENLDSTVCLQVRAMRHDPLEINAVDYDPEADQLVLSTD